MRDIDLKIGDIVYLDDATEIYIEPEHFSALKQICEINSQRIIKIIRPAKYETIYQKPQEILDKEEKEYLSAVIKPFRNKLVYIRKNKFNRCEWIDIDLKDSGFTLPNFDIGTMYKGMEVDREYTLEELGL